LEFSTQFQLGLKPHREPFQAEVEKGVT